LELIGHRCDISVCGLMTLPFDPGCVRWRRFGGVLDIAVFFSCSVAKAS
jgi:hypothetical protein